jgi:murein DD-endopeptidase MepM/ murein hydrolase activator NlpD
VPTDTTTAAYVGRRRADPIPAAPTPAPAPAPAPALPSPRRGRLAGASVPATAAAALSLVATGVGVGVGVDGAAAAQSGHQDKSPTGTVRTAAQDIALDVAAQGVVTSAAERSSLAAQEASRATHRAEVAQLLAARDAAAHRWVLPMAHYVLTSPFGMRWGRLHAGEDMAAPIGTPIHAISSGTVVFTGVEGGYGNKIEIRHWDGTCSWYGHLSKIEVKVGQQVTPGEQIGLVGDSGDATGPHLHLEIHPNGGGPIDPIPWLRAHGLHP